MKIKTIAFSAILAITATSSFADPVTDRIFASHQVNMGVRDSSAPLSYKLPDGSHVGMAVDICNAVVDELKKKDPTIKVNYIPVTSDNRIPLTKQGKIDMECGSTTNNKNRRQDVVFSVPYYVSGIRVVAMKKDGLNSLLDLKRGDTVIFTKGTTTDKSIFTTKKIVKVDWDSKGIKFKQGKDHQDSFDQLTAGNAKIFANDDILIAGLVANSKDPSQYQILPESFSIEPYGIMTQKDATDLQQLINTKIISMMNTVDSEPGSFRSLYNRWFMQPIPPYNRSLNWVMPPLLSDVVRMPTTAVGN
ncbi:PBPb domain-containing protein [Burkholderia cenocepacia]|uniref:amino acid ABC transporter substrate-binding protein n=1 Tax=Burkholderia cenocepacia TaxID=95486 RepID=UPI00192C51F6|nr:amino acid ABC transporter substrate-binding protein [Burkholderia cenocepacia]CAD9228066.1 PBPb domain-containing protein [Burkholderia cenocepacia]